MATKTYPAFTINGQPATGLQAQSHFVEWALALEQEHHAALGKACRGARCALMAVNVFMRATDGAHLTSKECMALLNESGITYA